MTAGIRSSGYFPSKATLVRIDNLSDEIDGSAMRLMAKMRLEGFSDRAIGGKLDLCGKMVGRLLDGKNIPRKPITVMAGVGNARPWNEAHRSRRSKAIAEGARKRKDLLMWNKTTTLAEHCEVVHGIHSRSGEYRRVIYSIRSRGFSVQDAVTFGLRLEGWESMLPKPHTERSDLGRFMRMMK